ncbi:MAG TPA: YkgJ family cysteine cluster protein [Cyclobacteriaceae bacterium]|jgi:Fe-S-cluster containining protein|nr:YkgJ family cysteine cluster protein [Cytophagales bacterium]HNT50999.1 YkgJ family cysteine cluster protein [Cyclobacteriaceae bacterium]HRE66162.1 YkgJ family cysteine cluster protein [Cyclobacteriaceae bacterium]HRF32147.1 YkgJ family cysteine cluster protein [Cyclobacteriaceae bacterium]
MTLPEKVSAVTNVFEQLDAHIATFQSQTTLHCKFGCGKCCFKPDIEASVLEFLPFAFFLYQNKQAEQWLEQLESKTDSVCLILNPTQAGAGLCSAYMHRGLICRLFGYSARTNKYGKKELVTCQIIKTEQAQAYQSTTQKIEELNVPVMNQVYMQLHAIDFELAQKFYPINQAIQHAIETVLHYFAYRD